MWPNNYKIECRETAVIYFVLLTINFTINHVTC